jgi:hypothetical protein
VGRNLGTRPMVYKALGIVRGGAAGKIVVKNEQGTDRTFLLPQVSPRSVWTNKGPGMSALDPAPPQGCGGSMALISVPSRRGLLLRTPSLEPRSSERRRGRRTGRSGHSAGRSVAGVKPPGRRASTSSCSVMGPTGGSNRIRGAEGLADRVRQIQASTLDRVRYVGEWHSHPTESGAI